MLGLTASIKFNRVNSDELINIIGRELVYTHR